MRGRAAIFIAAGAAAAVAGAAHADRYGMGEDLLYRLGRGIGELAYPVTLAFWMLALLVGGWALLRLKRHFEAPGPGGLVTPAVGLAVAVALATVPMLLEALLEGMALRHELPHWRGGYAPIPDDVPHRPDPRLGDLLGMPAWVFYALAALVGGGAILSFMAQRGHPERDGLPIQVAGILLALALLAAPTLVDAFVEGVSPGYRPPVWRGG